jgi:hypothetical protein
MVSFSDFPGYVLYDPCADTTRCLALEALFRDSARALRKDRTELDVGAERISASHLPSAIRHQRPSVVLQADNHSRLNIGIHYSPS